MSEVRVFVSFDTERDAELFEALRAQSSGCGFAVSGCSEGQLATDVWSDAVRHRIRDADQVIFICSEHTESSASMSSEFRIARDERTPYFLLWGRRETMCTKPMGAGADEGMYSWTSQILRNQILFTTRSAEADALAEALLRRKQGPAAGEGPVSTASTSMGGEESREPSGDQRRSAAGFGTLEPHVPTRRGGEA